MLRTGSSQGAATLCNRMNTALFVAIVHTANKESNERNLKICG